MTMGEVNQMKDRFLRLFVEYKRLSKAAEGCGISSGVHYAWMRNDPIYKLAFEDAQAEICEEAEEELRRRAKGFEEVKTVRRWNKDTGEWELFEETTHKKHSDALLQFLLKTHKPSVYGDKSKQEISGPGGEPLKTVTIEFVSNKQEGE